MASAAVIGSVRCGLCICYGHCIRYGKLSGMARVSGMSFVSSVPTNGLYSRAMGFTIVSYFKSLLLIIVIAVVSADLQKSHIVAVLLH